MRSFDHEPTAIIKTWHDQGVLEAGKGRKKVQMRVGGERPFLYAIRRVAIESDSDDGESADRTAEGVSSADVLA